MNDPGINVPDEALALGLIVPLFMSPIAVICGLSPNVPITNGSIPTEYISKTT